jgi:hypothetical protein
MADEAPETPDLPTVSPPAELYRIHRAQSEGLDLPPWQFARVTAPDGGMNFGGRWDDPNPVEGERFRTLSLGNDPIGVALEVFQSLRPDPVLASLEATIRDPDAPDRARPTINVSDLTSRRLSVVELDPDAKFLDVTNSKTRAFLEEQLEPMLTREGIGTLKIGDLLGKDTQLSQRVAELVRDQFPDIAGLVTPSTLGTDFTNFYVFEAEPESGQLRAEGRILESRVLSTKDPEVRIALEELRLDVALDADPTLTISAQPVDFRVPDSPPAPPAPMDRGDRSAESLVARLPVYTPGANELVERREDTAAVGDQTMTVIGRSEDSERVFGRSGAAVLSVSRDVFTEEPKADDAVKIRNVDGRDLAEPATPDMAMEL